MTITREVINLYSQTVECAYRLHGLSDYRITQEFYRNSRNKRQAVREILAVTDYEGSLRASAYAERFTQK